MTVKVVVLSVIQYPRRASRHFSVLRFVLFIVLVLLVLSQSCTYKSRFSDKVNAYS